MINSGNTFYIILLLTILGEFLLPWMLKHFYKGYNSKTMVMSALGNPKSPVRIIYNGWLLWLGIYLLVVSIAVFNYMRQTSFLIAVLSFVSIATFAIGAGILAGIFSINESKTTVTLASKIHGFGSALGFMTLLFLPLLFGIFSFQKNDTLQGVICLIAFVLALLFFFFFIMGDKEKFRGTIISYEGLWERLSLFFMYVPLLYMAMKEITGVRSIPLPLS